MVSTKMAVMYEHYDEAGWEHTQPGWYECSVRTEDIDKYDESSVEVKRIDKYLELIDWLYSNIGKCERHSRWRTTSDNTVSVKFRYEKDYIMFTLRWS